MLLSTSTLLVEHKLRQGAVGCHDALAVSLILDRHLLEVIVPLLLPAAQHHERLLLLVHLVEDSFEQNG